MDGGADFAEEVEATGEGEVVVRAVFTEGGAVDVLHDDVGRAVGGCAAIEEAGDVGVVERGEDLAFGAEAGEHFRHEEEGGADDFDGDGFFELFVVAFGEEDGAHAASAEEALDGVGAETVAGGGFPEEGVGGVGVLDGVAGGGGLVVAMEERFDVAAEFGVVGAGFGEPGVAAPWREFEGAFEERA